MPDAILGTTTTIESLDGPSSSSCAPGVQGGDVLTIKGRGITPLRGTQRGDLRVGVHVVTPTRLDAKERALIEEFAKRTKAPAPHARRVPPGPVRQAARPLPERLTRAAALPAREPDGARSSRRRAAGDAVVLTGAEAHHAAAVRRVRVGEEVTVGDGRGAWLDGRVRVGRAARGRRADHRRATRSRAPPADRARAGAREGRPRRARGAGRDRARRRRDRAVAGGAQRLALGRAPKAEKGRARWAAIVREAAKQAHRAWLPDVSPLATTADARARGPRHPASSSSSRRADDAPHRARRSTATTRHRARRRARGRHRAGGARRARRGRGASRCGSATPCCAPRRPVRPLSRCVSAALGRW